MGNSGSGKTTLAMQLLNGMPKGYPIILDGDELRECWTDLGFRSHERMEQNWRAYALALLLCRQGYDVIIATINPYAKQRRAISEGAARDGIRLRWIYLPGGDDRGTPFEWEHLT